MLFKRAVFFLLLFSCTILFGQNYSIVETTFRDAEALLDNNDRTVAVSGDLKQGEQFIILNLKERKYLKTVLVDWDREGRPEACRILGSIDYLNWFVISADTQARPGLNRIDGKGKVAQFIRLHIPQEKNKAGEFRIKDLKFEYFKDIHPKILSRGIRNIIETGAEIFWKTDYDTLGQIRFGLDVNSINKIYTEFSYSKEHSLKLRDLARGKRYHYQIINQTPENRYFTSRLESFLTKGVPLPEIEEVRTLSAGPSSVTLYVRSNVDTDVKVLYGKSAGLLEKSVSPKGRKKAHKVSISGLSPLSEYPSRIIVTDLSNRTFQQDYIIRTGEYNIALKRPVEGTFSSTFIADIFQLKGDVLKRVNDGSFDYAGGMAVSSDPFQSDQYVIVDLGQVQEIEKVITYWRALAYPYFYSLSFSGDKISWSKARNVILKEKSPSSVEGSNIPMIIGETPLKGISARYVKIFMPKGVPYYKRFPNYRFLQLMELRVYGRFTGGF